MAVLQGSAKSVAQDGGFYPTTIDQSLRFNDNDSAYLSRTPIVAGNRKTWTFSAWVKRGNLGVAQAIFGARPSGAAPSYLLRFDSGDAITAQWADGVSTINLTTTALYRDPSAWYHIVLAVDTTQATSSDRTKLYVNGEQITDFSSSQYPAQNTDLSVNSTSYPHLIGTNFGYSQYLDAYIAEVHFTDGTAYTADDFGEFKSGVWVAKTPSVTYGTNGFYLPFNSDYAVEGFNAVTYRGTSSDQYIGGVGFSPDLLWIKDRSNIEQHVLVDSVRGFATAGKTPYTLSTSATTAELSSQTDSVETLEADGFTLGTDAGQRVNLSSHTYVAWAWDAGTGSPVSNTDGTITSTVKANTAQGFSIVSYTGTGANATVGHGLNSAPEMVIVKNRDASPRNWIVYTDTTGGGNYLSLDLTDASGASASVWNSTAPTSSVFSLGTSSSTNGSTNGMIAYCFHSVAGYSSIGSYSGTGVSNTVTTGFRPAFVLIKATSTTGDWYILDSIRDPNGIPDGKLSPNLSAAESATSGVEFTDTGFTFTGVPYNNSGVTFIYMAFADTRDAGFFLDQSGNNNDWTPNVLTESDVMLDSPTNNFATFSKLQSTSATLSEGNLKAVTDVSGRSATWSTFAVTQGKWYAEITPVFSTYVYIGVLEATQAYADFPTSNYYAYEQSGSKVSASGTVAYGASFASGDIIGIGLDLDSGDLTFYKNGVSQGVAFSGLSGLYTVFIRDVDGGSSATFVANFGQDSSFAGNKTPQGYTDANGIGDFYYAPPTGYLALCTANLPEPAISPVDGVSPSDYFNTVLYTGNGSTQSVTGVGFQPDFTWLKNRSAAGSHGLFDVARGATKRLSSDSTNAEDTLSGVTSFDSDGFSLGSDWNQASTNFAAWNWKANGTPVSNTDGTITSSVSANTESGFSIVSYTGTGSAATVGHGLNQAPEIIISKNTGVTGDWLTLTTAVDGSYDGLFLNLTSAKFDSSWTVPSDTIINLSNVDTVLNTSGRAVISYCFHSVEGFSKIGSYVGNGSTDGSFVYCGFRPAFVMIKRTDSTGNWFVYDSERDAYNQVEHILFPDSSSAETVNISKLDFLSNGFKLRTTGAYLNASGGTYIFMAFAENGGPFKYSNAR